MNFLSAPCSLAFILASSYLTGLLHIIFCPLWRQVGEASDIEYRSVSGIDAYVPLINVRELTDPLLGMDVNDLPSK